MKKEGATRMDYFNFVRDSFNEKDEILVQQLIAKVLDRFDNYNKEHSQRVAKSAEELGRLNGLNKNKVKLLCYCGLLHDIGKLSINPEILFKPASHDKDEKDMMRTHATVGPTIIRSTEEYANLSKHGKKTMDFFILNSVGNHHRRWNGTGYGTNEFKELEIPFFVRILNVSDSFDAMSHDRPYSKGINKEEAIAELIKHAGKQFDPLFAFQMVNLIEDITLNFFNKENSTFVDAIEHRIELSKIKNGLKTTPEWLHTKETKMLRSIYNHFNSEYDEFRVEQYKYLIRNIYGQVFDADKVLSTAY